MNFISVIIASVLACSPQKFQTMSSNGERSHVICNVNVPVKITNSIRDIISNRLISLHYTELECFISEGKEKNHLQWKGVNSKISTPLPHGSIIQNFSISLSLGNNISPSPALVPVVENSEIPSLVFVNELPTQFLKRDIEKISYNIIDGDSEKVYLTICFSDSGRRKMKEINKKFVKKGTNYIVVHFSSGYTRQYNYFIECEKGMTFRVPYMETLLLLSYFKYPIPIFCSDEN